MSFFTHFIKNFAEELDRGENPFFPQEHYNYFKTRDNKFVSVGNLEPKFQDNFKKVLKNLMIEEYMNENNIDPSSIGNLKSGNNELESKYHEIEKKIENEYSYNLVTEVFSKYSRDELFVKVKSTYYHIYIIIIQVLQYRYLRRTCSHH